ncbi:MAG: HisA/HisF-related TIM barrel protein [Bacteroidota bacterium]
MAARFQLWPALDLLGGRAVRLRRGDYDDVTTYDATPASVLGAVAPFADGLHLVDLDGARDGKPTASPFLDAVLSESTIPVEVGGGLRTVEAVGDVLGRGAARAILGSRVAADPDFARQCIEAFGAGRIVVGLDVRDGRPATHGWKRTADVEAEILLESLAYVGVQTVIVTDIQTDGMMTGPNAALIERLAAAFPAFSVIASGGIATVAHLEALRDAGAAGAVFGRAWIEGALAPADLAAFRAGGVA